MCLSHIRASDPRRKARERKTETVERVLNWSLSDEEREAEEREERGEEEIIDDRSIVYETWVGGRKVYSTA